MRFSSWSVVFVCAGSLVVAGRAEAAPGPSDVRVVNTTPIEVDVGADPIAVDVGGPLEVDVINTTAIPVDVGGPLEVEVPGVLQVEGAPDGLTAVPVRVQDEGTFSVPFTFSGPLTLPNSGIGSDSESVELAENQVVVIKTISVRALATDGRRVHIHIAYEDGFGGSPSLFIPLLDEGDGWYANTISVTVPVQHSIHVVANVTGAVSGSAAAIFTLSGYQVPIPTP